MAADHEKTAEFRTLLDRSHENKWVAFAADYSRILAVSASLANLMRTISDPEAIFYRVLPRDVSFAPSLF